MYKPNNFTIHELAHPQIIKDIGEVNAWMRLDADILEDIQFIRNEWYERTGCGIYINRLDLGLDSRGLRPPDDPDGAFYSIHKQGKAFDLETIDEQHLAFHEFVISLINTGKLIYINTVEDISFTRSWTHVAIMNHGHKLLIIKP